MKKEDIKHSDTEKCFQAWFFMTGSTVYPRRFLMIWKNESRADRWSSICCCSACRSRSRAASRPVKNCVQFDAKIALLASLLMYVTSFCCLDKTPANEPFAWRFVINWRVWLRNASAIEAFAQIFDSKSPWSWSWPDGRGPGPREPLSSRPGPPGGLPWTTARTMQN